MSDAVSAAGERAAVGGYMPQFSEFANFAYRGLVANELEWIRIADPDAEKLDDIQFASATLVHAYQVKWTIAEDVISFTDFRNLLPGFALSWKNLRAKYQPQHKQVIGHLLTNKALSAHDRIAGSGNTNVGSFANFFSQVWVKLKAHEPYDPKWKSAVKKLITASGLGAVGFAEFVAHFDFHPAHVVRDFSITRAGFRQLDNDLATFRSYILEKVADASRPVEIKAEQIIADLNWNAKFKTTFNHELFVDPQKYQPIVATLLALDAKIAEHAGGYLFLAGAPGTGKSTLLTQWAKGRPERIIKYYAFDFSTPASPGNHHERGDSTTLFFDLVFQLQEAGVRVGNVLPYKELQYLRDVFHRQLALLGDEFARSGRKTILLIDGLDHVPREYRRHGINSFLMELPKPAELPAGVYLLLGSQTFDLEDLSQEIKAEWRRDDRKLAIAPLDRDAVFRLAEASDLHPSLSAEQKMVVFEKSEGHPLYLAYLLEQLRNSDDWNATLAAFIPIEGDINTYYRRMWEPIAHDEALVELLGLLARINGPINLPFIREWKFSNGVFRALNGKAKSLFTTMTETWSFFHNSFRQFLLHQTALDPLSEEYSPASDTALHRQLADYYETSRVEPAWHAIFHLYHAGETEQFLQRATPAQFVDHLLHFRPDEEIKRDLRLGLELASRMRDVVALTRYALAFAELDSRLRHVRPAAFVEVFLRMNRPELARRCLRTGNTLHTNQAFALMAARWFFDHGDPVEAAMLLTLAEPATVKADAIVIDEALRFDEAKDTLEEWVTVAMHFQALPTVLARLNNIQLAGEKKNWSAHENAVSLRFALLQRLALRAIDVENWTVLDAVLAEFHTRDERRTKVFFDLLQAAVRGALASDDQAQATRYLNWLLRAFPLGKLKGTPKIYVADLVYEVTGNLSLVRAWLEKVPQPTGLGKELVDFEDSLDEYEPFILLNKLLRICGLGVPITVAAPRVNPGADEDLLVDFLRMIGLSTEILADGLAGTPRPHDLTKRVRPIVRFYYGAPSSGLFHQHRHWARLLRIQGAYFTFLVSAVATIGPQALRQLADYLWQEFTATPRSWPPDVRRSILVTFAEQGYDAALVKPMLLNLEATMLEGKDADGRVTACRAQAEAWLVVDDADAAGRLLRQALHEAAGVGYRKDYQLSTWLAWLQLVNAQQPARAPDRLRWFLARLPHVRTITEGGSFWSTSEALLQTALAWNFGAGQQQLQWQLTQGLIDFNGALETFMTSYLARTTTASEYRSIQYFYTDVLLLHSPTADGYLLTALLTRGFSVLGEQLFINYLPALIDSIKLRALEEKRRELLRAIDVFVTTQGQAVTTYYPAFTVPPATRDEQSDGSGNYLKLRPDHQQMSEAEVLVQVHTYDDLLALLAREDAGNSYFDWARVLEKLAPVLSAGQIQTVADSMTNTRRNSPFYSTLSGLALQLGDRALARQLADRAVEASSATGWVKGYDGGTRLQAFEAMKRIDPAKAMRRAFDVFGHDLANANSPGFYIEDLDEILPVLIENFGIEMIWDEVFSYLERLFANSQPLTDLPALVPGTESIETVLVDLVGYLARMPVPAVNRPARTLLATLATHHND